MDFAHVVANTIAVNIGVVKITPSDINRLSRRGSGTINIYSAGTCALLACRGAATANEIAVFYVCIVGAHY